MKKFFQLLPAGSFIFILVLGWLAQVARFDLRKDLDENRRKALPPTLSFNIQSFLQFPAHFEPWFNAHFGMRNTLIHWNSVIRNLILKTPSSKLVIFGKEGWLFYAGESSLDQARNADIFSEAELLEIPKVLRTKVDWFHAHGMQYLLVVAPNSQTIYPEFLPDYLKQKASPISKLDQLIALTKKFDLPLLNLKDELLRYKQTAAWPLFQKTDTHWSALGAYYANALMMQSLALKSSQSQPSFRPLTLPPKDEDETFSLHAGGDLAEMLGLSSELPETRIYIRDQSPSVHCLVKTEPGLDFTTECNAPLPSPKVLVFRDSFFIALQPFFSPNFQTVRFEWKAMDLDRVKLFKPDLVIEEFVERHLSMSYLSQGAPK